MTLDRTRALAAHHDAGASHDRVAGRVEQTTDPEELIRLNHHLDFHAGRFRTAWMDYLATLEWLTVSRCPHSSAEVGMWMDTVDLDGLWWRYVEAVRPLAPMPASFVGYTGAVRLGADPTPAPFLCKPGPEVPYVLPRLLERHDVTAVLSTVPIGPHTGYLVAYFRSSDVWIERPNDWGSDHSRWLGDDGEERWNDTEDDQSTFDYELEPWLETGKLRWIEPGDPSLVVRRGGADCPYVDLSGRRSVLRISHGLVRTAADLDQVGVTA